MVDAPCIGNAPQLAVRVIAPLGVIIVLQTTYIVDVLKVVNEVRQGMGLLQF